MPNLTVLVPLDTTDFSQASLLVLPMLKSVGFDNVRLITVDDPKKKTSAPSLENYLDGQAARVKEMGLAAETRIVRGDAADALLSAAAEPDVDLILVATHGRTGLARLRLGSVSEKLIKEALCPRLVVGPNVEIDLATYALKRLLVPLDGSDLAEASLPVARHLAGLTGADVDLIQSVSPPATAGEASMGVDMVTPLIDGAQGYLSRISATFNAAKVSNSVVLGAAGDSILDHLKTHPVDLVIMASRGLTGLSRAAFGSVTERVLQGPDPVLVFEPGEDRSRLFQAARETNQA